MIYAYLELIILLEHIVIVLSSLFDLLIIQRCVVITVISWWNDSLFNSIEKWFLCVGSVLVS